MLKHVLIGKCIRCGCKNDWGMRKCHGCHRRLLGWFDVVSGISVAVLVLLTILMQLG